MNPSPPRILVASDFSAGARHAAERAALVARDTGAAALTLLHVMPADALSQLRGWLGDGHEAEAGLQAQAQAALDAQAARLQQGGALPLHTAVQVGPVADTLLQQADAADAALIAVGARGAGFVRRFVLGSTAERLMRRSTRPLLVVRQPPHEPYRRVLVAVDFSPWTAGALAAARRLAPRARPVLATVFQLPYEDKLRLAGVEEAQIAAYRSRARVEATRKLHALAEAAGLRAGEWEPWVAEGDPAFRLLEAEQSLDCDLVVLGKHGTGAMLDLLLGSVTQRVLAEGGTDVLIATHGDAGHAAAG